MVNYYKRYIYKNGIKQGPYYYSNKKINGKVISTYLGTSPPKKLNFKYHPASRKIAIAVLSVICVVLLVYLAFSMHLFSTGKQIETPDITGIARTVPGEEINETNLTIIKNIKPIAEPTINTIQGPAVINQPVKFTKEVTLEKPGKTIVEIPIQAENVAVYKITQNGKEKVEESKIKVTARASSEIILNQEESSIIKFFKKIISFFTGRAVTVQETSSVKEVSIDENEQKYEVEYETPAPYTIEEATEKGKTLKIVSPNNINYQDVLTSANLDEALNVQNPDKVKIYWVEQNTYLQPTFVDDKNSNGVYDYLEFIAPLSNQTYEIIVITKAEHLDSNRTFISDIYNEVKELDDVWSEPINDNEYVRVTFEKNLTQENDITIYPRIVSGSPKIEVYEKDKNELIAEFLNITDNDYNQVLLTNLQAEQDTFDLKILGGNVEFDYILDPYASPSPPVGGSLLRSQQCLMESSSATPFSYSSPCLGVYPAACGTGGADRIGCNDGFYEQQTITTNNRYTGMFTNISNFSINNCASINQVFFCYEWWRSGSGTVLNCVVQIDANRGASYTSVSTTCPGTTANPAVTCTDVTALEPWSCGVFFGSGAIGALARNQMYKTSGTGKRQLRTDTFYFNVSYTADTTGPTLSNPNTNTSSIIQNNYFCLNITAADSGGVSQVLAEVWNTAFWLNYTMSDTGTSCSGIAGDNVYGVEIQGTAIGLWSYSKVFAKDSFNNWNSYNFVDLTINVAALNQAPTIPYVQQPLSDFPAENSIRTVNFEAHVSDADGFVDINDSSVKVNFSMAGEPIMFGACSKVNNIDANTANYSCSVDMWYYNKDGIWDINITANDLNGAIAVNDSNNFTYGLVRAMVFSPSSISWPTLATGATNQLPGSFVIINNTGNYEGPINITAYDLSGEINPLELIPASNFRAGNNSGSECVATQLQNATSVSILGSNLPRGPSATVNIYYCLNNVPLVSSQAYSATGANSWTIGI